MKAFLMLSLLILSAQANTDIQDIINQYKGTLYNFNQAMTASADTIRTELVIDSNGNLQTEEVKYLEEKVVLRVNGTLVYEYEVTKNIKTGDVERYVTLNKYDPNDFDGSIFKNARVVNDTLLADIYIEENYGGETFLTKGTVTKDLLSSFICNVQMETNTLWTMSNGDTINSKDKENAKCVRDRTLNELKAIKSKLKNIEFCDYSIDDDVLCDERDMSYLLNNI
jgi:hypothetical protein